MVKDEAVSNLLGSPASGELSFLEWKHEDLQGFQFIGFPSEWGVEYGRAMGKRRDSFQFIGFPSEWGGNQ